MTDTMTNPGPDTLTASELRFERLLDAPVATVWQWIVDPELRARWFMGGPTDLRPGGKLGLTMNHDNLSDDDVPAPEKYRKSMGHSWSETISRVEPERLLAFGWDDGENGEVTITLTPVGSGVGEQTRLELHHKGISNRAGAINFAGGWASHLAVLERRIRGDAVPDFWALHAEAAAAAERVLD